MRVDIQFKQIELEKEIKEHIRRQLELALSRTAPYITGISITLSITTTADIENKQDKHCLLKLSVIDSPDIVIEDTQNDLFYVIDRAIQKAQRTMERIVIRQ